MGIEFVQGDATDPQIGGNIVIAHIANDEGKMGAGFVIPLKKAYPSVESEYKALHQSGGLKLGNTQFITIRSDQGNALHVANMVAQRGTRRTTDGSPGGCVPLRYDSLYDCLREVGAFAVKHDATVVGPKFGAGLAGGRWELIRLIIEATLVAEFGRRVVIFEFEPDPLS